ncbi:MAG TPA: PAS domain-containing protein, partial [Anaerolineae bacterium]|nr:PAS domain-containing protein [Anaerolineae bacterium]
LTNQGLLFLGKAEMLLTHANLFSPLELKHRIFAKVAQPNLRNHLMLRTQTGNEEASLRLQRTLRLQEAAFETIPLGQIVVDSDGTMVLANNLANTMFGLSARDVGQPFRDMELSYLPAELRSVIDRVYQEQQPITLPQITQNLPNGFIRYLEIRVTPLYDKGRGPLGVIITFNDLTQAQQLQNELQRINQELETAYEELQSANEELETTNEELQSTVEELETTNEELQSTNEEMETMNEELQSTNEELRTTNEELHLLTDRLNLSNAFFYSILSGLDEGVVVVNDNFRVLEWNQRSEDLWGLRADEVQGQFLLGLDIGLPVEQLREPIRDCLAGENNRQIITYQAVNRRGKNINCHVTFTPLIGPGKERQGVILMMEEVEI